MGGELSLRKRVQDLKKTDPEFFGLMLDWRDQFNERKKGWLDSKYVQRYRDMANGRIVKRPYTVKDALQLMWKTYLDDEEWGAVLA